MSQKKGLKIVSVGKFLFWLLWAADWLFALWCCGAIGYQRGLPMALRAILLVIFISATLALRIFSVRKWWLLPLSVLLSLGTAAAWFTLLEPTGKREWDPPFAVMPTAHFSADGKTVTIENIRDFHYRTEDDYEIRYRTERYPLDGITAMDYSITHWNDQEPFGHIMLSFTFKDGRRLVFTPEARMTRGKKYEILPGFFRQYELIFLFTTEEDAFQLRTHHRRYEKEELLLYPTNTQPEVAAFLLKDFLLRANRLQTHPEFYNGITYNCLSTQAPTAEKLGFSFCSTWRGVFNGYSDRLGYHTGWLRRAKAEESFEELRKRCSVNQYVETLTDPPDYSQRIRPYLKKNK